MPAALYARWRRFFAAEPWGFRTDWLRAGTVAACVLNTAFGRKSGSKPVQPGAFVPEPVAPRKRRTWQEEKAIMMGWCGVSPHAKAEPTPPPTPTG